MAKRKRGNVPEGLEKIQQLRYAFQQTFSGEQAEAVLTHLKELYYIQGTTYTEPLQAMAYNEGQRSVVLYILNMMDPERANLEQKEEE